MSCRFSSVFLAFGISLSVIANVVMNSGEAFVKAASDVSGLKFGNVKIGFDIYSINLLKFSSHYLSQ